jgi:endogenous inhibitor of DNA gyrase (YacG/DUF329 family)
VPGGQPVDERVEETGVIHVSTDHQLDDRPNTENHLYCAYPHGPRPCWHCGRPTCWVELSFEAPLCPGPCTDVKWTEYWLAEGSTAPFELKESG